ncbi:aspartate/glutamate racemase family protein [Rhodococcus sp. NBC_00294]|uniref:aspartate/glutamate racemase family protein n=1 Tax=Rhodococcus sp. NBC_00294 TaxID=2976004 RepID=UPI002E28529B|nr:aspartate/glutamate racemase family protein [Rhodococcus sp. NBC_00294]
MSRLLFLNPFGSSLYDDLIRRSMNLAVRPDTDIDIRHLTGPVTAPDFWAQKHLLEVETMSAAIQAEDEGYDGLIIGCCYDPGVAQCREIVDIPVIGPLEASLGFARAFGRNFAVVTDHRKAATEIEDQVRKFGFEPNCKGVTTIDWYIDEMVDDITAVARKTDKVIEKAMADTSAETVILGCTIVSACYEIALRETPLDLPLRSVMNPNLMAVKMAEMLVDLAEVGQYRIARTGYYAKQESRDPEGSAQVRAILRASRPLSALDVLPHNVPTSINAHSIASGKWK